MFPNLEAELKRRDISRNKLAEDLGIAVSTVYARLSGKSPMPVAFAKRIKRTYEINVPMDELFEEANKNAKSRARGDSSREEGDAKT